GMQRRIIMRLSAIFGAAVLLTTAAGGAAFAAECVDGQRMTISATIADIKWVTRGKLTITLTGDAGCEIWGIAADEAIVPSDCRRDADIEATGTLDNFMGYIAVLDAEKISCN